MPKSSARGARLVPAVHGRRATRPDEPFEQGLVAFLTREYTAAALTELYGRFATGDGSLDERMRRTIWRALARRVGSGLHVGSGTSFKHPETFVIGDGVFIGDQVCLQGRIDGTCRIGNHVWIGPHSFLDARDLIIDDYVGWGPGAKVLGSTHTGMPPKVPIIRSALEIKRVRIGAGADIGVNAVVLPGVTVGKGAIVGAGAVVTHDVPPFGVVAGVPAKFLRWRRGYEQAKTRG